MSCSVETKGKNGRLLYSYKPNFLHLGHVRFVCPVSWQSEQVRGAFLTRLLFLSIPSSNSSSSTAFPCSFKEGDTEEYEEGGDTKDTGRGDIEDKMLGLLHPPLSSSFFFMTKYWSQIFWWISLRWMYRSWWLGQLSSEFLGCIYAYPYKLWHHIQLLKIFNPVFVLPEECFIRVRVLVWRQRDLKREQQHFSVF